MQAVIKNRHPYLVLLILAWAAIMVPVTVADAAGGSKPTATIKQLKKQVKALERQVAAIQGQVSSPRPPGGPAGGDLIGLFPNPLIGPNAVGTTEIQKDAVTAEEISDNAVGTDEIANGLVGFDDLGADSVGRSELKGVTTAVSPIGKQIGAGQFGEVEVSCPNGGQVIAGGFAWSDDEANSIIHSAPNENNPEQSWLVRGFVPAGSNTLYAWATCLAA